MPSTDPAAPRAAAPAAPLGEAGVSQRWMTWLIVTVGAYVACSLVANIMSLRAVTIVGWAVDAGTLTYPLTFTLRDMLHKVAGPAATRTVIVMTALLNIGMALALWAAASLPPDMSVGLQEEFGQVLVMTWRIVAASVVAQVIAELVDTEIYQRFTDRFGSHVQFGRVLSSNAVSVPLDSVIFTVLAFWGTELQPAVGEIIVANIVIKGISSLVTAPLIYAVPEALGRRARPAVDGADAPGGRGSGDD